MRLILVLLLTINVCWAKSDNRLEPSILLYNQTTGAKILDQNTDQVRPLASITKLMTAIVAIDSNISPYEQLPLYHKLGSLLPRKNWTREDLMTAMLVRSDNAAAETLARDYPGGREGFMYAMNAKANQLGMINTHFDDPSGLSQLNTSTAIDITKLLLASAKYEVIRQNSIKKQAIFETKVKQKVRTIKLEHTSAPYLFQFDNIVITKTGLTTPAGWCVALLVEQKNQTFVIVVLGSKTKQQRLDKVKEIMYNHVID